MMAKIPRAFTSNFVHIDGRTWVKCKLCEFYMPPTREYFKHIDGPRHGARTHNCVACEARHRRIDEVRAQKYWNRPGYVYFIQILVDSPHYPAGTIKIGFSANITERTTALGYLYHSVNCLGVIKGVFKDEKKHHQMFSQFKISREMFRPEQALLDYIEANAEPSDAEYTMVEWRDAS